MLLDYYNQYSVPGNLSDTPQGAHSAMGGSTAGAAGKDQSIGNLLGEFDKN